MNDWHDRTSSAPLSLRLQVANWWQERLDAGCQLSKPEAFIAGYDYIGDGPWFNRVAIHTLWQDFCLSRDMAPRCRDFVANYKLAAGRLREVSKFGAIYNDDGSVFIRPRRQFIIFAKTGTTYDGTYFRAARRGALTPQGRRLMGKDSKEGRRQPVPAALRD